MLRAVHARRALAPTARTLRRFASSRVLVCGDESSFSQATEAPQGSVVYFTATWCPPCKMISPIFEAVAKENTSGATFLKIDVDDLPEVAGEAGVSAMPTFQFYRSGKLLDKIVGADPGKLKTYCETHLS